MRDSYLKIFKWYKKLENYIKYFKINIILYLILLLNNLKIIVRYLRKNIFVHRLFTN
ncbi:hypothetical protein YN1_0190 [Nanoarchaeota archaeon]